jgi:hypothetical protein
MLIVDGKVLIRIWMGSNYPLSYPVLVILTLGYVVLFGQAPSQLLIFARASYYRALSWLTLVEGAANLALSILWARKYGLVGVALGTSVPLIFSKLFIQPLYALKDLELTLSQYFWKGLAKPVLVGAVFIGCGWLLLKDQVMTASLIDLVMQCTVQGLIFCLLCYTIGMTERDKDSLRHYGVRLAASLGISKP